MDAPPVPPPVPVPFGPQPNIPNIRDHMTGIVAELNLFENVPAIPALLQFLQQQHQQQQQQYQQQQQQHAVITNQLNQVLARLDRLPMQLQNATLSLTAPLLYPMGFGFDPPPPLPRTKRELLTLSGANCDASLAQLGLEELIVGSVAQRRQALMDYLGCAMWAE